MSDDLIRENATLKAENTRRRHQAKQLQQQLAEQKTTYETRLNELTQNYEKTLAEIEAEQTDFVQQFSALEEERDTLRGELDAAPETFGQKATELEQQLLNRDHQDAWKANIYGQPLDEKGEVRIRDDYPIESLWRELGYKPEGKPDAAKLKQLVLDAREAKKYLFATGQAPVNGPPGGGQPGSRVPPLPPGPGADRGSQVAPEGVMTVTRAQMRDPKFTTNPENAKKLTEAAKTGKLNIQRE